MLTTEGVIRIGEERVRQITGEGHDARHDEQHTRGGLAQAAACYLMVDEEALVRLRWPWAPVRFKRESFPEPSPRDVEKGGALAAAEWDRLEHVKREWTQNGGWVCGICGVARAADYPSVQDVSCGTCCAEHFEAED